VEAASCEAVGQSVARWGAIARVAAKRLAQRGRALKLVERRRQRGVLDGHMRMMRLARTFKREKREEARRLPDRLTTVREVNAARAQYGIGPVSGTPPVRQLMPGERCDYILPYRCAGGCVLSAALSMAKAAKRIRWAESPWILRPAATLAVSARAGSLVTRYRS